MESWMVEALTNERTNERMPKGKKWIATSKETGICGQNETEVAMSLNLMPLRSERVRWEIPM